MTPEKSERYRKISAKAGIACSCCVVLVFLCVLHMIISQSDIAPEWIAFIAYPAYFGAIISTAVCLLTAIVSRIKPN
jgi:hypothetical protein